ncbi:uncharacterized protein LOC115622633 [Scaptodrosophila lebanonensis]|uniref:Uncharacterized protein LOC115622633 n=1 Tax=Drosophila lebanonensis TaxID=7225 RepID=A0A6J2T914_DROLE|nr:uncharacterized protein LOC115622633 [Scaptodrosophila lebanonensis]
MDRGQKENVVTSQAPKPPHIDAEYVERALRRAYNSEQLSVESCQIEGMNQRGENFCSDIYRVRVAYRQNENGPLQEDKLILKDLLPILAELGSSELHMNQQVLPAMAEIVAKAEPKLQDPKLSAKCIFAERAFQREIYLFEDLCELGYRTADRYNGLSFEEASVCMQKMAQFHAVSMQLIQEQPVIVDQLAPSDYLAGLENQFGQILVLDGTAHAADVVANWPGMAHIAAKMRAQCPKVYSKRMSDMVDPKKAAFTAIVHGDLWVNNTLLTPNAEQVIFVDYQNCFVASPALDLIYFLYTSIQLPVLQQKRTALIETYYESFAQTLRACRYPLTIPAYGDLLGEVERCLFYGYYGVVVELPICCASKAASEDFTLNTISDRDLMRKKRQELLANERVCDSLKSALPYFEQQGILEAL